MQLPEIDYLSYHIIYVIIELTVTSSKATKGQFSPNMLSALVRKSNSSLNTLSKAALIINALKHVNGSRVTLDHLKWLLYKTYGKRSSVLFRDLPDVLQWCLHLDILRKSKSNYIIYNDGMGLRRSWVSIFRFLRDYDELRDK